MTQERINEICNTIVADGKKPFALVSTKAEMKTPPASGWDVFDTDTEQEVCEVFDDEEKAREKLRKYGAVSCREMRGFAGQIIYDCNAYIVCGLIDESEEGDCWYIDFGNLLEASPVQS